MTVDDERGGSDGSNRGNGANAADGDPARAAQSAQFSQAANVPGSLFDPDIRELSPEPYPRDIARARRYLPPPGIGQRKATDREPTPERHENKLARRAKLVALLVALALVVASLVVAASLAAQGDSDGDDAGQVVTKSRATGATGLTSPTCLSCSVETVP